MVKLKFLALIIIGGIMMSSLVSAGIVNDVMQLLGLGSPTVSFIPKGSGIASTNSYDWVVIQKTGDELKYNIIKEKNKICLSLKPTFSNTKDIDTEHFDEYGITKEKTKIKYKDGKWCYHISKPKKKEKIKIGSNTIIMEYQEQSRIQYNFDWGETNIYLSCAGVNQENLFVYYNNSQSKFIFGANGGFSDIRNCTYILNSTAELVFGGENKNAPSFYNYWNDGSKVISRNELRHIYSFAPLNVTSYSYNGNSAIVNFISNGTIQTDSITNVSSCSTLNIANEYYKLNKSISYSSSLCLNIVANNITLDGQGYWINFTGAGATTTSAVYTTNNFTTIKNMKIGMNYSGSSVANYALQFSSSSGTYHYNTTVNNCSFYKVGVGYETRLAVNANISNLYAYDSGEVISESSGTNNTYLNIYGYNASIYTQTTNMIAHNFYQVYGTGSSFQTSGSVYNVTVINSSTVSFRATGYNVLIDHIKGNCLSGANVVNFTLNNCSVNGIIIVGGYNEKAINGYINATNLGIYLTNFRGTGAQHNYFQDIIIENSKTNDTYINAGVLMLNNTFLNVSYTKEAMTGTQNSQLIRKWWYQAKVNDSNGNNIQTNVSAFNITGFVINLSTDSNGLTIKYPVTEYIRNTTTFLYQNNWTFNVTNSSTISYSHNLTIDRNIFDIFTFSLGLCSSLNCIIPCSSILTSNEQTQNLTLTGTGSFIMNANMTFVGPVGTRLITILNKGCTIIMNKGGGIR